MKYEQYRELVMQETKEFNPKRTLRDIYDWLDKYIEASNMKRAVLGISGGKDSTVVASILVNKLGKENVLGLLMPNGVQKDIDDSIRLVKELGIDYNIINIKDGYNAILNSLGGENEVSAEAKINIAPRIRMTTLYTYGQTNGCRVAGTGNLSELTLGYFTKHGDGAHDFNIIGNLTSLEVMRLGEELGLPLDLVYKTPDDGLSGMSDEEKLGITYIDMHKYLRDRIHELDIDTIKKITDMKLRSMHKRTAEPMFEYTGFTLPEIGKHVVITDFNGNEYLADLVEAGIYEEGVCFEDSDTVEHRVDTVRSWVYAN